MTQVFSFLITIRFLPDPGYAHNVNEAGHEFETACNEFRKSEAFPHFRELMHQAAHGIGFHAAGTQRLIPWTKVLFALATTTDKSPEKVESFLRGLIDRAVGDDFVD